MRLTNVSQLRLPFGRLIGYDVAAGPLGGSLPVSFDQERHVGAGDRPGSWMALAFTLSRPVDREELAAAWLSVIARHGTLRSAFTPAAPPRLHELAVAPGSWREHPIGPGQSVEDALRQVLDAHCRPFSRPAHRLCALETADATTVVIGADHAHVDMWSMLVTGRDLLAGLEGRELPPAPAFAEHTAQLAGRPRRPRRSVGGGRRSSPPATTSCPASRCRWGSPPPSPSGSRCATSSTSRTARPSPRRPAPAAPPPWP